MLWRCAVGGREVEGEVRATKKQASSVDCAQDDSGYNARYHLVRVVRVHWPVLCAHD